MPEAQVVKAVGGAWIEAPRLSAPRVPVSDRMLAMLMVLTMVSFTATAAGVQFGLGDLALVPALVLLVPASSKITVPTGYLVSVYLYLVWSLATLIWTENLAPAVASLIQYTQFFLVSVLIFSTVSNLAGVVRVIRWYVVAVSALAVAVIVYAGATGGYSYVYFLDYQKNGLGAIVGNAIPLILGLMAVPSLSRKWLRVALLLCVATLLLSTSRGSMLGVIGGSVVFLALTGQLRRSVQLVVGGGIVFWLYVTFFAPDYIAGLTDFSPDSSAYSRVLIFQSARDFIGQHFFIGNGLHSYRIELPSIGFQQDDPSNLFLLNLAEVGLIGTVLFVSMLMAIASRAWRNAGDFATLPVHRALSAGLAGAVVSHLIHIQIDVSWVRGTGTFVFACVGLLFALSRMRDEPVPGADGALADVAALGATNHTRRYASGYVSRRRARGA